VSLKEILNQASQFQANAGSTGLDLSAMPIKLQQTFTFETADAFDGPKSALWKTSQLPSLLLQVAPNSNPVADTFTSSSKQRAQTFKLSATKSIVRVGIRISAQPAGLAPGTVTVEIQSTAGAPGSEKPSGTVLAAAINPKAANTIVGFPGFPPPVFFTDFDLPAVTLQAGVTYALVVKLSEVNLSAASVILWGENNDALNYPDGRALRFVESTQLWEFQPSNAVDDYDFRIYEGVANPEPVVTGGFLQFDYPSTDTPKNLATIYDSVRGSFELETRFLWSVLAQTNRAGLFWGLHMLQGSRDQPPLSNSAKESKLLWECLIRHSQTDGPQGDPATGWFLSFVPFVVTSTGQKLMYSPSSNSWVGDPGPSGYSGFFILPAGAAVDMPVTLKVQRQANGGLVMLAYKNDNPSQLFQTQPSPPVRELPGDTHLLIGHSPEVYGSRFRFDYFKLSGEVIEPPSGEVILRRSYPIKTKVTGYRMDRVLPAPGSRVNVRIRSADTLEALAVAAFGDAAQGTAVGNIETGQIDLSAALFFDVKLEFIKASPGPTLNSFDFTSVVAAVIEDQPLILGLDELDTKDTPVTSEESSAPTANTLKMADGDPETQWVSLGNAQDGQQVQVIILLGPLGTLEPKPVNTVILRNTNIKSLQVFIGNSLVFDGEIDSPDEIFIGPTETTAVVTIIARSTNPPNQNKKIGEVYIGRFLLALPGFDSYEPRRKVFEAGTLRTLGGRLVSFAGISKYGARWRTALLSGADKDVLEKAFRDNRQITFWPEPASRPREIFDVGWTKDDLPHPFTDVVKGAGHSVEAEVEEV
jgi:hypothetical protein